MADVKDSVRAIVRVVSKSLMTDKLSEICEEWIAKLFRASLIAYQNDQEILSFLSRLLGSLMGVKSDSLEGAQSGLELSASFRRHVTQHIFSTLPLDLAMKRIGTILLNAAQRVEDYAECISVAHAVSCFQNDLNGTRENTDDTFFPAHAHLCDMRA